MLRSRMPKIMAMIRALIDGRASIQTVDKIAISRTPGDVTELNHN